MSASAPPTAPRAPEPQAAPGALMAAEIAEQPDVLAAQADHGLGAIRAVAEQVRAADPRCVLLAARGTSDHAALYAKYLVETELGLPAGLASLSSLTAYGSRPRMDGVLWLAVSQSGGSPDLVDSTAAAARAGALTLAVTNARESALAQAARLHVDIGAGPEVSVAATKSYTAQLQALWLLVDAWRGGDGHAVRALPTAVRAVLDREEVSDLATRYRFVDRLVTTGRGFSYPTAREAALKLMETCYLSAHAFSGADLLHGPFAMVDHDRPVVVVAPEGVGGELLRPVLERLRDRRADVCIVGSRVLVEEFQPAVGLALPAGLDERLSPVVQIVPLQQLALQVARMRHLDPDRPRGLRKVTETL
jgi:glucosamine--fructose-6-phosphate aminotransferase (isomerizing)